MIKVSKKIMGGGLLAAMGLSAFSPVQQGAALVAAGTAALWTTPALAQQSQIPGVGVVIKKKPGNAPIMAPSDANGEVRISGLEPGDYEVAPLRLTAAAPVRNTSIMKVGPDGNLAFSVCKGGAPEAAIDRKASIKKCVGRKLAARRVSDDDGVWIEPITELKGGSVIVALLARTAIDVNKSSAQELQRGTLLTPKAADFIIADRTKNGLYKGFNDFAQRVCTVVDVDFDDASIKLADQTVLVRRGGSPKDAGFKCSAEKGTASLFGQTYTREVQFGLRFTF